MFHKIFSDNKKRYKHKKFRQRQLACFFSGDGKREPPRACGASGYGWIFLPHTDTSRKHGSIDWLPAKKVAMKF